MARIFARLGVVDRDRGRPLPETLACKAIILQRSPGPNGLDYVDSDVASIEPVAVKMSAKAGALRPDMDFVVCLKRGTWDRLHLCLIDDSGAVFAMGALYAFGAKLLSDAIVADHEGVLLAQR